VHHRFYAPVALTPGIEITLIGDEAHHATVVRLREGEPVELFDGRGTAARGRAIAVARDHVVVHVDAPAPSREAPINVRLAMAIVQLEKFDLVLQKATELGAHSIVPLVTDRIEVRAERYRGKAERWNRIVFEAVKQSGRAAIPLVESPTAFVDAVAREGTKIVFDAEESPSPSGPSAEVTLFVGPEGGWSDSELALARERQCAFETLGARRLRAETAAIVAMARHVVDLPA
jgi:16S rRNA (uracil1498-N3)-methyltransferase